jgi:hypothetical protein
MLRFGFACSLAAMVLSGCDAQGELGREGSPVWHARTTPEERADYFRSICEIYGFEAGTPAMAQCVANESRGSRAQASARMQAVANMNKTTTTNCTSFGVTTTCTTR